MQSDRFLRGSLIAIIFLLAVIALRPVFAPADVRAQSHYSYQLVAVTSHNAREILTKYTNEGWEPIDLSYYWTSPEKEGAGYLLLKK